MLHENHLGTREGLHVSRLTLHSLELSAEVLVLYCRFLQFERASLMTKGLLYLRVQRLFIYVVYRERIEQPG